MAADGNCRGIRAEGGASGTDKSYRGLRSLSEQTQGYVFHLDEKAIPLAATRLSLALLVFNRL